MVVAEFSVSSEATLLGEIIAESPGVTVESQRVIAADGWIGYFWLVGDEREEAIARLQGAFPAGRVGVVDELPDRTLVRIDDVRTGHDLFEAMVDANVAPLDASGGTEEWTFRVWFPDPEAVRTFHEECVERGVSIRLARRREPVDAGIEELFGLSSAQKETILAAFERGYFDVPRRASITDLAGELDVSGQAVSERLRRGLATLLSATLPEEES